MSQEKISIQEIVMDESPERYVEKTDETDTKIRQQKWIMVGIKRVVK